MVPYTAGAMDQAQLHDEVTRRLAGVGQRYTTNRRTVVDLLVTAQAPLTLPDLLASRADLSQSSTYRSLAVLEEAGAIRRLVTGLDHARFELAEDLSAHHHHLVCSVCGAIVDFELDAAIEARLERVLAAIAAAYAFRADHHTLDLVGRCSNCR